MRHTIELRCAVAKFNENVQIKYLFTSEGFRLLNAKPFVVTAAKRPVIECQLRKKDDNGWI